MIDPWIYATGAVLIGLLSGLVGAALVRRIILRGRSHRPEMHDAARATALFLFLFFTALGVIVAIGFTDPETLKPIPADILRRSPQVLAAGLILIAARAIAYAFGGMINNGLAASTPRTRSQISGAVNLLIYAVAIVLALSQLGVDTTVLSILAGAVTLGVAMAFALLVGLGGRELGGELAAGRYLHRLVDVGDTIETDGIRGTIVALHPASVELIDEEGTVTHLPNTRLSRSAVSVVSPETG